MPSRKNGNSNGGGIVITGPDDSDPTPVLRGRRGMDGRLTTPPPEELEKPATVGYVYMAVAQHYSECSAKQTEARNNQWTKIAVIDQKINRIWGGLKLGALIATLLVPALVAIMIPLTKYAVKGVVSEEIDKKLPSKALEKLMEKLAAIEAPKPEVIATAPVQPVISTQVVPAHVPNEVSTLTSSIAHVTKKKTDHGKALARSN